MRSAPSFIFTLAGLFYKQESFDEACAQCERAVALDPELVMAWYEWGAAETARREYVTAVRCFEKALELQPGWFHALHNPGPCLV